jgi:hypothetical protein
VYGKLTARDLLWNAPGAGRHVEMPFEPRFTRLKKGSLKGAAMQLHSRTFLFSNHELVVLEGGKKARAALWLTDRKIRPFYWPSLFSAGAAYGYSPFMLLRFGSRPGTRRSFPGSVI